MQINVTNEGCLDYLDIAKRQLQTYPDTIKTSVLPEVLIQTRPGKIVIIWLLEGSFLSTPRKHKQNDGYLLDGKTAVNLGLLEYPLLDTDKTTQTLIIGDDTISITRDVQLYGNIDWIGPVEEDSENTVVLTWKGPLGRTIPYDNTKYITGISVADYNTELSLIEYTTCFGPNVYSNGEIYATLPSVGDIPTKVLGAAIQKGTLVCIVNNHYADKSGFFEEVWILKNGDWMQLYSRIMGRPTQCWFFNVSGTKATQGLSEYSIDIENERVSLNVITNPQGSLIASKTDGTSTTISNIKHTGEYTIFSDYKGDERVFLKMQVSDEVTITNTAENEELYDNIPIWTSGTKPPVTAAITGPTNVAVGDTYSITGDIDVCCTIGDARWSFSKGTINSSGTITSITGCGVGVVSVTLCDTTYTKNVVLPTGTWVLVSCNYAYVGNITQNDPNCTVDPVYIDNIGTRLTSSLSGCSAFYLGFTPTGETITNIAGDTKVETVCGSFSLYVASSCSFGCGGGAVTKVPASGGATCSDGYPQYVAVYKWMCTGEGTSIADCACTPTTC